MKRRLLPDECYDFFVRDGRDGETWGPFDTLAEAKAKAREMRKVWPRGAHAIKVEHAVNERKVLKAGGWR